MPASPIPDASAGPPASRPVAQSPSHASAQPATGPAPAAGNGRRLLVAAYFGFAIPTGSDWASGPRVGALLGWHVVERLSLNIEGRVDYVRANLGSSFWDDFFNPSGRFIDVTFSPLLGFHAGQIRVGPKIGWFVGRSDEDAGYSTSGGVLAGLNAGLFVPYRTVTVGGLISVDFRFATSTECHAPGAATCGYLADSHHALGLMFALLL
jgi:hypothetical protein